MRLPTIERYLARQIWGAAGFVLVGFLALFAFFDLIAELRDLGRGDYQLRQIFSVVLLGLPSHAYELFPVAVLIGTLYVLAHLSSNFEFIVMRAAGLTPQRAALALAKCGLVFVVATFVIGEWIAPFAEESAQRLRMQAMSSAIGQDLRSGLWFKDEGSFINVREARESSVLLGIRIYEFDAAYQLRRISAAERGEYAGAGVWRLSGVAQTRFGAEGPSTARLAATEWRSAVSPELLNVLLVVPERMSIWKLYRYTQHLAGNKQKTERYEIAMWKKLFYPVATLVMMALALPFAYLHARAGLVGVKVFLGIMLGIFFHMLNSLFSHIGLLQNWPPVAAAAVPSVLFFVTALAMMIWLERVRPVVHRLLIGLRLGRGGAAAD
ncbi:MAG: LPS export ABC transporter permease LptG [Betaproteobacteria bacterium]|nr:MAG: LPS export ABC transporter permease LptG [Betaproteobacteria bacterium]